MVTELQHRAHVPKDDGQSISFHWHFQRGLLKPRMSGLELGTFILSQMPHILPFFSGQPRVKREFEAMMTMLATSPAEVLDRLLPWIRCVYHEGEDDIIHLSLFDKTEQPKKSYYTICQK